MKLLITLLVTLGISMGSYGGFKTGGEVLQTCEDESDMMIVGCIEYLVGVADGFKALMETNHVPKVICIPPKVNGGQLSKVVVKYLNEHPEDLHYAAAGEVFAAYIKAFPCEE